MENFIDDPTYIEVLEECEGDETLAFLVYQELLATK